MKPRIFISHSSFDDPYANELRGRLESELGYEHEVWLDKNRLRPGDRWRDVIYRELLACHGAVLLLSPDALASPWVLKEATILSFRGELRERFKLVPVLLGGVTRDQVEAAFPALYLSGYQMLTAVDDIDDTVAYVAAILADLTRGVADDMGYWTLDVTDMLSLVSERALQRVLARLTHDHEPSFDPAEQLAHVLLHDDRDGLFTAMNLLKGKSPDLRSLIDRVVPAMIDEQMATPVRAAMQQEPGSLVTVDARSQSVGSLLALRAACWSPNLKTVLVGTLPTEATYDELADAIAEAMLQRFGLVPSRKFLSDKRILLVIVVKLATTVAGTVASVLKRVQEDWPSAVIVAMTGDLNHDGGEPPAPFAVRLPDGYEEALIEDAEILRHLPDEPSPW